MSRAEIFEKLKEIFSMITGSDEERELTEQSNLTDDIGLNSVGVLYIVIGIEEMFGVRFEGVGVADFRSIGDVINYIEKKLD